MNKYTHLKLNQDVKTFAGYYTPLKEVRLKYNGNEVLYVFGQAVIEASCCGNGTYEYVLVPGYIINWQNEKNENGLLTSDIEIISDEASKNNIRKIIGEAEHTSQIEFW